MKGDYTLKGRELFGVEVWQKTKDEFFCVTDLVNAGNKYRRAKGMADFNLSAYLGLKHTKEFINELEKRYNIKPFRKGSAKKSKSYAHPLLFIDIALSIDSKLKIEVYEWLLDELVKYRVKSGNAYNLMCGVLFQYCENKARFQKGIQIIAREIKETIGVNDWDRATQEQLADRDYLCNLIADFTEANMDSNRGYIVALSVFKKRKSK